MFISDPATHELFITLPNQSGEPVMYKMVVVRELRTKPNQDGIGTLIQLAQPILGLEEVVK